MVIAQDLLYSKEHEWVKIEADTATVGITDYAQQTLGDITFVELPKVGEPVEQFKQFATVESVKAASDVYSPVYGKVVKVNQDLVNSPELINQSPYDKGWFALIQVRQPFDQSKLLSPSAYKTYLEGLAK